MIWQCIRKSIGLHSKILNSVFIFLFFLVLFFRFCYTSIYYPYFIDDAYITLKYAYNLFHYSQFKYNLDQYTLVTTTPLTAFFQYFLALALNNDNFVFIGRMLNIVAESLLFFVSIRFLCNLKIPFFFSILIALALSTNTILMSASSGGMETPLFLLVLTTMLTYASKKKVFVAYLSILAIFIRPEAVLLSVFLFFYNFKSKKISVLLPLVLGPLVYMGVIYLISGELIPNSVLVKNHLYREPLHSLKYIWNGLSMLIPIRSIPQEIRIITVLFLALLGTRKFFKSSLELRLLTIYVIGLILLFVVKNPSMWFWYLAPISYFTMMLMLLGIYVLLQNAIEMRFRHVFQAVFFLFIVANIRWVYISETYLYSYTNRIGAYKNIVDILKSDFDLNSSNSILTHEIGAIGYYSNSKIFDAIGLASPDLAEPSKVRKTKKTSANYGLATLDTIQLSQPDFILFQQNLIPQKTLDSPDFKKFYQRIGSIENSEINNETGDLILFKRIY